MRRTTSSVWAALTSVLVASLGCTPRNPPAPPASTHANAAPEPTAPETSRVATASEAAVAAPPTAETVVASPPPSEDAIATDPPPTPQPVPFEGRDQVTYAELVDALRDLADELSSHTNVALAHERLLNDKGLTETELPRESFSRARLVFESARDSGLWGIRGTITDQMPWSDRIWKQWSEREFTHDAPVPREDGSVYPTAVAECDELGALFAFITRDLGVVGFTALHWPFWNHVVPVWQVEREDGKRVRIVVPATQTFLTPDATMGTTQLKTDRAIFPYGRKDRKPGATLDANLVRFLLHQSRAFGTLSTEELTERRIAHRRAYP